VPGLLVSLVVAVPALTIEEDWHGRPMIDQTGHLWVLPTVVAAIGLILGGAVSGRRATGLWRASLLGALIGMLASAVLVTADLVRRAGRQQTVSPPVLRLWVEAALISGVLAAIGAAASYLATAETR
jgi:hypothetical protein